jgi:hypothetical protein
MQPTEQFDNDVIISVPSSKDDSFPQQASPLSKLEQKPNGLNMPREGISHANSKLCPSRPNSPECRPNDSEDSSYSNQSKPKRVQKAETKRSQLLNGKKDPVAKKTKNSPNRSLACFNKKAYYSLKR